MKKDDPDGALDAYDRATGAKKTVFTTPDISVGDYTLSKDGQAIWFTAGATPVVATDIRAGAGLVLAGLLVGFGTRMGNGCTSGHGVCGLARLSARSFAAVVTFMTTAMATTFAVRHLWSGS